MAELPVSTTGEVIEIISERLSLVRLKNGKEVTAFPGREAEAAGIQPKPGDRVSLEMTPFDFSKARISGLVETADS